VSWDVQTEGNLLPRDSLAEIMAADEVVAAKNQMHAVQQLQQRAASFDSSKTHNSDGAGCAA
jgi:hypothetical protein